MRCLGVGGGQLGEGRSTLSCEQHGQGAASRLGGAGAVLPSTAKRPAAPC